MLLKTPLIILESLPQMCQTPRNKATFYTVSGEEEYFFTHMRTKYVHFMSLISNFQRSTFHLTVCLMSFLVFFVVFYDFFFELKIKENIMPIWCLTWCSQVETPARPSRPHLAKLPVTVSKEISSGTNPTGVTVEEAESALPLKDCVSFQPPTAAHK